MARRLGAVAVTIAALLGAAAPANADFGLLGKIGTLGTEPGQFQKAAGMAFDPGGAHVYVADDANNRIQRLNVPGGQLDATWHGGGTLGTRGPAATPLDHPIDVAVDSAGNLFVVEGTDPMQPGFGHTWLVHAYDANGNWLRTWGDQGTAARFTFPAGIATYSDPKGTPDDPADDETVVYVAEGRNEMNERVQKFDSQGVFLLAWGWGVDDGGNAFQVCTAAEAPCETGLSTLGDGGFRRLQGIATDATGGVWTVDGGGRRVQRFTADGDFVAPKLDVNDPESTDCCTSDHLSSDFPGIDIGPPPASTLVVIDQSGGAGSALRAFAPDGQLLAAYTERCPAHMYGVAAHPSGDVYVGSEDFVMRFGDGGTSCPDGLNPPPPPPPPGTPPPPPGPPGPAGMSFTGREGVTIAGGALYTNEPVVPLTIVPPNGASDMLISNDGGFSDPTDSTVCATGGPGTCTARAASAFTWPLRQSGLSERLPRTVYVRFANAAGISAQTFTDDIILDTIPPQTQAATLNPAPAQGSSALARAATANRRRFVLRVRARDNSSGVNRMQLAIVKRKPAKVRRYKPRLTLRTVRPPRFVRVLDRAGNVSRWRAIRRAR